MKVKNEAKKEMLEYKKYMEYKLKISRDEIEVFNPSNYDTNSILFKDQIDESSKNIQYENKYLSNKKKEKIKGKLDAWSQSLTAHGLANIFRTQRRSIKTLWSIFLLFSVGYCIHNIYSEIKLYFNYEYVTHLETVIEMPTPFPTISICNINPLITKRGEFLVKKLFKEEYDLDLKNHSLTPIELIEKLDYINLKARLNAFLPEYGDESRKLLGYELEEILIECFYNHHICSHKDFVWYYSLNYGNCYQFNSGFDSSGNQVPIEKSYKPGAENGLSLMFFLGESKNRFTSTWSTGLKIFIHNNSVTPSRFEGTDVKPTTSTNIGVKRTFEYKLPRPYSQCIDFTDYKGSDIYKFMQISRYQYRQKDCFALCLQKDIIETCDCYDLNYQRLANVTPCLRDGQLKCANEEYLKYIKENINEKCSVYCPLECDEVMYDYTISSSDYPTEYAYEILKSDIHVSRVSNLTYSKFKERSLMINIYYSQLNYLAITQLKKFEFMDLLASIGGLLGFFVGMSLLSFIELAEILMEIIMIII